MSTITPASPISFAPPAAAPAPRHDIYAFIHKGLRAALGETLAAAGRLDVGDAEDVAQATAQVRALLDLCEHHLENEERELHPALERRRPGSAARTAGDHVHHVAAIAQLRGLADALDAGAGAARAQAAAALYRALALFVADNLEHMNVEETQNNAVLWAEYTDEEIRAIEQRIVASHTPDELAAALRWMVPSMAPVERANLLGGIARSAPREAFEGLLASLKRHLSARDWFKLTAALAPMPVTDAA